MIWAPDLWADRQRALVSGGGMVAGDRPSELRPGLLRDHRGHPLRNSAHEAGPDRPGSCGDDRCTGPQRLIAADQQPSEGQIENIRSAAFQRLTHIFELLLLCFEVATCRHHKLASGIEMNVGAEPRRA